MSTGCIALSVENWRRSARPRFEKSRFAPRSNVRHAHNDATNFNNSYALNSYSNLSLLDDLNKYAPSNANFDVYQNQGTNAQSGDATIRVQGSTFLRDWYLDAWLVIGAVGVAWSPSRFEFSPPRP